MSTSRGLASWENSNCSSHPWISNAGLKKLCTLLRNEGDKVLSGNSSFTLTTEILAQLNMDCRRHSVTENDSKSTELSAESERGTVLPLTSRMQAHHAMMRAKAEWSLYIQFIKDFMLSTPSLKIIHNSGTLSSPISLHRFGNLSTLQLRKVPIHMVEGLHKLRGTLTSLSVHRCVDKVKDLLESCGGDMSAPLSWPQLKFVSFMFNTISSLDDSLRLLPYVDVLDLSHNSLDTCDDYLEYLGDIVCLTLAYNSLTCFPSFSVTSRATLTSLFLRGNSLDSVNGLEELGALQELDLGENCFSEHSALEPLGALTRLRQLQLDSNPLFYHKYHRIITVSFLARQVVCVEFELDKKRLTLSEISNFPGERRRYTWHSIPFTSQAGAGPRSSTPERDFNTAVSQSSGIGTDCDSTGPIASSSSRKRGKRKRLKARRTEIMDMETSGDFTSSQDGTPGTCTPEGTFEKQMEARREEAIQTKEEIENLRKHYGPNWLQAIEDKDIFNRKKKSGRTSSPETCASDVDRKNQCVMAVEEREPSKKNGTKGKEKSECSPESGSQKTQDGFPTDDDLYLTDTNINDANNPIMAAIARLASGKLTEEMEEKEKEPAARLSNVDNSTKTDKDAADFSSKLSSGLKKSNAHSSRSDEIAAIGPAVFVDPCLTGRDTVEVSTPSIHHLSGHEDISKPHQSILALSKSGKPSVTKAQPSREPEIEQARAENANLASSPSCISEGGQSLSPIRSSEESSPVRRRPMDNSGSTSSSMERSSFETETSLDNSSIALEESEVTEPMFVTLPSQDNKMIIVTLTESYLVEKDIQGKILEKLELTSLIRMEATNMKKKTKKKELSREDFHSPPDKEDDAEDSGKSEEEIEGLKLNLKFDYVNKDRRKRCYFVDPEDGKILTSSLQPFLDAREEEARAKMMVVMQCLKCNRTFLKSEVTQKSKQLPTSGSSKDLKSLQELMDKTTYMCPKCGSTILIELESAPSKAVSTTGSASSTPHGSLVLGGYMEQAKKPAPLVKGKSFDHTSPQASLPARILSRKNSSGSIDMSPSKRSIQSSGEGSESVLSKEDKTRAASPSGRERSNAFAATGRMTRSALVSGVKQSLPEKDEDVLVCVDDHFSGEQFVGLTTTRHLANMTTSLRGDLFTQGSKAWVRQSLPVEPGSQGETQSGSNSQNQNLTGEAEFKTSVEDTSSPTKVVKIERQAGWKDDESKDSQTPAGGGVVMRLDKENKPMSESGLTSRYRSLAAMEDIVNTLVSEGQTLEEQEALASTSYGSSGKGRSVSISTFLKSSGSYADRRISTSSMEGRDEVSGLRHADSNSSITVLPIPGADASTGLSTDIPVDSGPVTFSVGSMDIKTGEFLSSTVHNEGQVMSPLSSNICSSMVSSVYETSVNTPESDSGVALIDGITSASAVVKDSDISQLSPSKAVVIVGSSDSEKSSSSEDLTSIYDRPRKPRSKKIGKSKLRAKDSQASQTAQAPELPLHESDTIDGAMSSAPHHNPYDKSATIAPTSESHGDLATLAGFGSDNEDNNDESSNEDEQDMVPLYAFHHLNHRLTLYMMMSLFGNDEEFVCKLQCEVEQYIVQETYEGILVMSSLRFYILRITSNDHTKEPHEWLHCVEIQPIPELRYVDIGLGGQTFRLEFVTDCSSFTFTTRNRDKTVQFVDLLHTKLAKYAVSQGISSQVIVNEDVDQTTLNNLDQEVVSKVKPNQKLLLYCMGFIERGNQKMFPVSFVITSSDICLVRTNHQWPQPRLQAPITIETVGKQFTVLERQSINNVACVEVFESSMKKLRLELFNEIEGVSFNWNITMASRQSTVDFINALSDPWSKEFGVEMEVKYAESLDVKWELL